MSKRDSIEVIKESHRHNNFKMETTDEGPMSVTAAFDAILSKKRDEVNMIVLHRDSNGGKSIILKSAFEVFADINYMYQGCANNFMFEGMEDAEVCIREEGLFAPEYQETIKIFMEGAESCVAASLYGMASAIEVQTGKVADFEMKSKVCYKCRGKSNLDVNSQEFIDWIESHGPK